VFKENLVHEVVAQGLFRVLPVLNFAGHLMVVVFIVAAFITFDFRDFDSLSLLQLYFLFLLLFFYFQF